jgi:hypothetical protein
MGVSPLRKVVEMIHATFISFISMLSDVFPPPFHLKKIRAWRGLRTI